MNYHAILKDQTKATSQHQITIPKKIWTSLHLEAGTRFNIILTDSQEIVVIPQHPSSEITDVEWKKLVKLAHSKSNVSKTFSNSKEAIAHLRKL